MAGRVVIMSMLFLGCGTVRTPFSGGPEEHAGEIACHGVLLPAKGSPRALFLCAGGRNGCATSRKEQIAKGYTVSDCAPHPHAACMPTDNGQICLGSLDECRDFAKSAARDPEGCTTFNSEIGEQIGAFSGSYDSTRGAASVLRAGSTIDVRTATGSMQCTIVSTTATCTWIDGDKKGRAKLAQQADGSWSGTSGEGESDTSVGPLTFRRRR